MHGLSLAGLLAALVIVPAHAAPRPSLPKLAFEKYVLPNGLQLILHANKKLPLVHVNLSYHVGSKNEDRGRSGFAHLFEHLMLQGSKNAPEDYFTLMARAGAKGGRDSNGTTGNDLTNYWATAPWMSNCFFHPVGVSAPTSTTSMLSSSSYLPGSALLRWAGS